MRTFLHVVAPIGQIMRSLGTLLLLFFFAVPPLTAQRIFIENTVGVGPRAGWYESTAADEGALYYGFQARLRWGRNVGLEVAMDYRDNELFGAGTVELRRLRAEVMYIPVSASLMIFAPVGAWLNPYGVAGIGWYYSITEYDLLDAGTEDVKRLLRDDSAFEPGYHFGLGLEIPLTQNISIHADARYLFLGTEIRTIHDIVNAETGTKNSDGIMFSGGLMFYL
ncbi:MAG: outer membrane beta-barrel protein [Bacteroidetes bacterium]|nr:outer membrane beta-barrel protein [Bacteroidota bacterium]